MHPNYNFRWPDKNGSARAAMEAMIAQIGFGMIFATTPDGPRVAHVPIFYTGDGAIQFHLANGNALTKHLDGMNALCVINGPDSYISPDWYGSENQVPTWNYMALELEGPVRTMNHEGLMAHLDDLSRVNEEKLADKKPWTMDKIDQALLGKMTKAITGFEMEVKAWRDTLKLNQNKNDQERENAATALEENGHLAMAHLIRNIGK